VTCATVSVASIAHHQRVDAVVGERHRSGHRLPVVDEPAGVKLFEDRVGGVRSLAVSERRECGRLGVGVGVGVGVDPKLARVDRPEALACEVR
jgi:hypothetical protein